MKVKIKVAVVVVIDYFRAIKICTNIAEQRLAIAAGQRIHIGEHVAAVIAKDLGLLAVGTGH